VLPQERCLVLQKKLVTGLVLQDESDSLVDGYSNQYTKMRSITSKVGFLRQLMPLPTPTLSQRPRDKLLCTLHSRSIQMLRSSRMKQCPPGASVSPNLQMNTFTFLRPRPTTHARAACPQRWDHKYESNRRTADSDSPIRGAGSPRGVSGLALSPECAPRDRPRDRPRGA
jgi:hypothetical protein